MRPEGREGVPLTRGACSLQGVNIMAFCKEYNAQTAKMAGQIIPVEITVYEVGALSQACCMLPCKHTRGWA